MCFFGDYWPQLVVKEKCHYGDFEAINSLPFMNQAVSKDASLAVNPWFMFN